MNRTLQERLVVFVAPVLCTTLAVGWILSRDVRLVADELGAELVAGGNVHSAPIGAVPARAIQASDDAPLAAADRARLVSNVVLNELVGDPHFGETEALDSTVGDYSRPDPLSVEMLRRSYEAESMGLADHQDQPASAVQSLDSTVGDYSQPDPLTPEMLLRSYQAAVLGLVNPPDQLISAVSQLTTAARVTGDARDEH